MNQLDKQLVKITVAANQNYLGPVLELLEQFLLVLKLDDIEVKRIRLVTEEACLNVIQHAFDPDEEGEFDIIILQRPNKIVIGIEDEGLPIDFKAIELEGKAGLGMKFMKAFTDEVAFINNWHKGKRIELIKNIPVKDITEYLSSEEKKEIDTALLDKVDDPVFKFRFLEPEDSIPLARCVYRSYGYSYPIELMYYPDKLKENIESYLLKSCIVEDENNEIVGHLGLTYDYPGQKIADSGKAVVDPRYRGHKLFKKMKDVLIDYATQTGMYGIYSECVTVHPYTQQGNLTLGGHEIGVILGFAPETMNFKKIESEETRNRQAAVMFYLRTNDEPNRNVFLPFRHEEILGKIIHTNKLNRNILKFPDRQHRPDISKIELNVNSGFGIALFHIIEPGNDLKAVVKYRINELSREGIPCILLDMDLSEAHNAECYLELEELGFYFSCIIPEKTEKGDIIRYQYLSNLEVDPSLIKTASDFGQELLEYTLQEREDRMTVS
jgi:anti-sigma regulatory factor (Ser/Thr protein kinase)